MFVEFITSDFHPSPSVEVNSYGIESGMFSFSILVKEGELRTRTIPPG